MVLLINSYGYAPGDSSLVLLPQPMPDKELQDIEHNIFQMVNYSQSLENINFSSDAIKLWKR
jgi:hypothetical protein